MIKHVRNFVNSKKLGLKLTEIQFMALSCLKNLVQLRVALERIDMNDPVGIPTENIADFARYFAEVKRLEFEYIIDEFLV